MNILVTGGAGYVGSLLLPKLLARGHRLRILDIGYFGVAHLRGLRPGIELIREDIREMYKQKDFCREILENIDCVIHLAAISNDPSAELNPTLTHEVNFRATEALARESKRANTRFVFSSSCSVYGAAPAEVNESGIVDPLTAYARSKVASEEYLSSIADESWSPVVLRNGTLFGFSTRMRFDLVVNIFALMSTLRNEITVFGEGLQWRPFLHVSDCARALVFFAELEEHNHVIYNIAHQNLRVLDLIDVFKRLNPGLEPRCLQMENVDTRDYKVSTERMKQEGFEPQINIEAGAEQMIDAIISGAISDPESIYYRNAKWMKELTQFGTQSHKEFVGLMQAMAQALPGNKL